VRLGDHIPSPHLPLVGQEIRPIDGRDPLVFEALLDEDFAAIHEPALGRPMRSRSAAMAEPRTTASGARIAVVPIAGPLMQRGRATYFGEIDGYDRIEARFADALANADAVVLLIDSPGGACAGCFEAADRMIAMRNASGKPVVAFADELAASAAYAMACIADAGIIAPPSGFVGSVGVISMHATAYRAWQEMGVDFRTFRSGPKKAIGGFYEPLSEDAAAELQKHVDDLAQLFASHVATARGKSPAEVLALEGALFSSKDAKSHGLLDQIGSLEDAVRIAASAARKRQKDKKTMSIASKLSLPENAIESDCEAAIEALQKDASAAADAKQAIGSAECSDLISEVVPEIVGKALGSAIGAVIVGLVREVRKGREDKAKSDAEIAKRDVNDLVRQGREEGKLTAASEATFREAAAENLDRAKRDLASRPVVIQRGEVPKDGEKAAGKLWEDYSVAEKASMQKNDPALFASLHGDFKARNRGY
jgi:signal peptide peptidase SppA